MQTYTCSHARTYAHTHTYFPSKLGAVRIRFVGNPLFIYFFFFFFKIKMQTYTCSHARTYARTHTFPVKTRRRLDSFCWRSTFYIFFFLLFQDNMQTNTCSHARTYISCVYLFLTPNYQYVFRAGVSLNIHSFIHARTYARTHFPSKLNAVRIRFVGDPLFI